MDYGQWASSCILFWNLHFKKMTQYFFVEMEKNVYLCRIKFKGKIHCILLFVFEFEYYDMVYDICIKIFLYMRHFYIRQFLKIALQVIYGILLERFLLSFD